MVAATLNGKACSLELPPECLSVADATSFAKSKLSAVWAAAQLMSALLRQRAA